MKVVVAIDSFKGSLTSIEAGTAIKKGILAAKPDAEVTIKPLADGGEGTTAALCEGLGGEMICLTVTGPLGHPVAASYGYIKESRTAILEMASAAGLTLISEAEKNPFTATTYGVGEMITAAMEKGCRNFLIGIGGSATNDGGIGMLQALGYDFLDECGNSVGQGGQALSNIASIIERNVSPTLDTCHFHIACDVKNPLCGPDGASYIYGPQKGAAEADLHVLDSGMRHFAEITTKEMGNDYLYAEGAGAAGGLGFAMLSYLKASLTPGIDLILEMTELEATLENADFVITGEGRLDHQTIMGKAPIGVAKLAKKHGLKVLAFAGSVTPGATACNAAGIDAFFPIVRGITTLEEAMLPENAKTNLTASVEQVFRLL